jgi:hypothetical protein
LSALATAVCAAPKLTAVHTFDHRHADLTAAAPRGVATRLETWASGCRIVETSAGFQFDSCEPEPARDRVEEDEVTVPATVALVRDLEETAYVVACPLLDEARLRKMEKEAEKDKKNRIPDPELEADLRDCADIEAGRTFSAEVESEEMRLVIRGRQLRMRVFRVQPKERTTSTPYKPEPSKTLPHAGPDTTTTAELNPVDEPNWTPPSEPRTLRSPVMPEPSLRNPQTAKTGLRAGRLRIECKGSSADVWIDGAYYGAAPLETPLMAGKHAVVTKQDGRERTTRVELEAGDTETVDGCGGR